MHLLSSVHIYVHVVQNYEILALHNWLTIYGTWVFRGAHTLVIKIKKHP